MPRSCRLQAREMTAKMNIGDITFPFRLGLRGGFCILRSVYNESGDEPQSGADHGGRAR